MLNRNMLKKLLLSLVLLSSCGVAHSMEKKMTIDQAKGLKTLRETFFNAIAEGHLGKVKFFIKNFNDWLASPGAIYAIACSSEENKNSFLVDFPVALQELEPAYASVNYETEDKIWLVASWLNRKKPYFKLAIDCAFDYRHYEIVNYLVDLCMVAQLSN